MKRFRQSVAAAAKQAWRPLLMAGLFFCIYMATQFLVTWILTLAFAFSYVALGMQQIFLAIAGGAAITDAAYEELVRQLTSDAMEASLALSNLISFAAAIITVAVLYLVFTLRGRRLREAVWCKKTPAPDLFLCLLGGVALNFFASCVLSVIPFPESWLTDYTESSAVVSAGPAVIVFLATVVAAPVLEEIVFRGLIYNRLRDGMPIPVAALISSAVFAVLHGSPIWICYTFVFGLLLVAIYERTGSIFTNIALHVGFNLFGILSALIPERVLNNTAAFISLFILSGILGITALVYVFWRNRATPRQLRGSTRL